MFLISKPLTIGLIVVGVLLIISLFVFLIIYSKKPKKTVLVRKNMENETVNDIITFLGGKQNILDISKEGQRIKVTVSDLELVQSSQLQTKAKGVFISGNNIKMLFDDELTPLIEHFKK